MKKYAKKMSKIKIRKIIGRDLDFLEIGYMRVQLEMDAILLKRKDVSIKYDSYDPPKNIIDHFWKRLVKYPRYLRKTDKSDIINHIIVQNLSDLARKLDSKRTVIHLLDVWNFINRKGIRNNWLMNRRRLKGLRRCKNIIAISEFSKREAIEKLGLNPDYITIIQVGVNRDVFHPVRIYNPIKRFKILHVGTEIGRKDFLTLLYALYEVKKHKDVILYRVGNPEYLDEIKKLDLEFNIIYISEISDVDLNMLYNAVDLFVFPSNYEGYGLPIMEALSCGTPVICSDIPVFKEIYGDCVRYFPVGNSFSLSTEILAFSSNRNTQRILIDKGLKLAKENTWEKVANQYYNYIKQRF
ncbi:hypothetical protein LCGC14_1629190 [marine sediment metagenome]|uniref:Glycosyl transferase family 1 domain-containing protein n=1 Tax=marine sediment metagenome TaxID=412755 RepID=A0A0F9L2X3_9ZZZZ